MPTKKIVEKRRPEKKHKTNRIHFHTMGIFSWITSDTNESIPAAGYGGTLPVKMITPDGRVWEESEYAGYGVFGGQDFFELVAELNNLDGFYRRNGAFVDERRLCGVNAYNRPDQYPNLVLPKLVSIGCQIPYDQLPNSEVCPDQLGIFYDDEGE
jgi:hypothetical protein